MEPGKAREIFLEYAASMAYVAVRRRDGTRKIGSAFHVGEGVFVTARHVVQDHTIEAVMMTEQANIPLTGRAAEEATSFLHSGDGPPTPVHWVSNGPLTIRQGPYFHQDRAVDVAVFQVVKIDPLTPVVQLGSHLDDWLGATDFVLSEAIVLGYPPIPMTVEPRLIAARAEVNAVVDPHHRRHAHFILSSMPRGGFSGGPAISEYGYALGVVTESLLNDDQPSELGFMAVLGVESLYTCLADHKLLPACQAEGWDDFWNSDSVSFGVPGADPYSTTVTASLDIFDDSRRFHLTITCDADPSLFQRVIDAAQSAMASCTIERSEIRPGMVRLEIKGATASAGGCLRAAADAAAATLEAGGHPKLAPG